MNHKRKRPKNRRSGCLMCKPYKGNGMCPRHLDMRFGNLRRYVGATAELKAVRCD